MGSILSAGAGGMSTTGSVIYMVVWIAVLGVIMYFLFLRPQKKEQNRHDALVNSIEVGDSVLTTSGFYGVVIGISDDTLIVEFGNNKNCRIPMEKNAIKNVEKPGDSVAK